MKNFWSWVVAGIMAPILLALFIGAIYGVIWILINLSNPEYGHLPDILGGLLVLAGLAWSLKVVGISDMVLEWISNKWRGR